MYSIVENGTIQYFNAILYWPHMVAYLLYLTQKILMFLGLIYHVTVTHLTKCERLRNTGDLFQCFDLAGIVILCGTCCYACACCFSCFGKKKEFTNRFTSFIYRSRGQFDRWMVKTILGKEERIVSRVDDYVDDREDESGIPKLYIHNQKLNHIQIRALYLLIFMFGLLTFGSAWSTFIFNVTHTCVDDHPNIFCFVVPSGRNTQLNERITNCSKWSNSDDVEFTCFQFAYNTADALATFGGLLALFQIVVSAATGVILSLIRFIFSCAHPTNDNGALNLQNENNDSRNGINNAQNEGEKGATEVKVYCDVQHCKRWIKFLRFLILFKAAVIEIGIAISVVVLLKTLDKPSVGLVTGFLQRHGSQVLVVIAIIGTIPMLPLEEYVAIPTSGQGDAEELLQRRTLRKTLN